MTRQIFAEIENQNFDLIVVGGGITGSAIVRDAAARGLTCLLLDKGDFACGTSSKSGKLIHGGLRYLKYFHLGLVYESCNERMRLLKHIAPHLVKPVRLIVPFYENSRTPRWLAVIGLLLYGVLALWRNVNTFQYISKCKLTELEPHLRTQGLRGGLGYYDCMGFDTRLTIDTLKSAADSGALLLNYAKLDKIQFHDGGVNVSIRNMLGKEVYYVNSRALINACGAWADDILIANHIEQNFALTMTTGIHLVFSKQRLPVNNAMIVESVSDPRNLYLVPWQNYVLVGTTDNRYNQDKDHIEIQIADVRYLLDSINYHFPDARLTFRDIHSCYAGIRPLVGSNQDKDESKMSRDYQILVDQRGLLSISGGKLTTNRSMAKQVVDKATALFFRKRKLKKCSTITAISGGEVGKLTSQQVAAATWLTDSVKQILLERYGSNCMLLFAIAKRSEKKCRYIADDIKYIWAEIDYFVEYEFAERVADIMLRRTALFLFAANNGCHVVEKIAAYMGKLKGWNEQHIAQEVKNYNDEVKYIFKNLQS